MAELRQVVASLGHGDVASYIQSGNVVFTAAKPDADSTALADLAERAEYGIQKRGGRAVEAQEVAPWSSLDGRFLLDGFEDAIGVLVRLRVAQSDPECEAHLTPL